MFVENDFKLNALKIAELIHSVTFLIPRMDGTVPVSWCRLSEEEQICAEQAVKEIYSNPARTAEQLHELWMDLKLKNGWKLGTFNLEAKTHPCLIPFNDLPPSELCKDLVWEKLIEAFRPFYEV